MRCIMQMRYLYVSDFLSKTFANWLNMQKMFGMFVNKITDHDKPHFDSFYITISMLKKLFLSERELKKAFHNTLTRAAFFGLLSTMAN